MDTTYENTTDALRNGKQRVKSDLTEGARHIKDTTSTEFKNFAADVEDVIKRVSDVSDADIARTRAKIEAALYSAKSGIAASAANLRDQARRAAGTTDDYVRNSPWQAVGIAAGVAALIGLSLGFLSARRN